MLTAAFKFQNAIKAANSPFNSTKHVQKLAHPRFPFSRNAGTKFAPFLRVSGHIWLKMDSLGINYTQVDLPWRAEAFILLSMCAISNRLGGNSKNVFS